MTAFTQEEIKARIEQSTAKRAGQKKAAQTIREFDRKIRAKLHENRSKLLYAQPMQDVTVVAFRMDGDEVVCFWTVRHTGENESFKTAKKYLGRFIDKDDLGHKFMLYIPKRLDAYTLAYYVGESFILKALLGEIKVPSRIKRQLKRVCRD